jgi:hypothetical protein
VRNARLQDEDDAREEEKDTRKLPPPGKSESPRLSTSERRRKQKLLLKKKAATKKQAEIAASALALVKLLEANAEGNKSEELSDTESENVENIVNSKAVRRSAKIEALERLVEKKKRANRERLRLVFQDEEDARRNPGNENPDEPKKGRGKGAGCCKLGCKISQKKEGGGRCSKAGGKG